MTEELVVLEPEVAFQEFPKIARLNREIVVTEKIDGTNGQVVFEMLPAAGPAPLVVLNVDGLPAIGVWAGSRNRWVTLEGDNFGFARWVHDNAQQLYETLGVGRHYGEWWGAGIQRRYGQAGKRFSLFAAHEWPEERLPVNVGQVIVQAVPVLHRGPWITEEFGWMPQACLNRLRDTGSAAAPGFMKPEGVVVFHRAGQVAFKATIEGDERPKGSNEPQ